MWICHLQAACRVPYMFLRTYRQWASGMGSGHQSGALIYSRSLDVYTLSPMLPYRKTWLVSDLWLWLNGWGQPMTMSIEEAEAVRQDRVRRQGRGLRKQRNTAGRLQPLAESVQRWRNETSWFFPFHIWYHTGIWYHMSISSYDIIVSVMISLTTSDVIIFYMISWLLLWYHIA